MPSTSTLSSTPARPGPNTAMASIIRIGIWAQMRFAAIWIVLAATLLLDWIFLPRSVELSTLMAVLPFAAFLAIAAAGQGLVLMARGIDLSVPAIVSLSSAVLLGMSNGDDARLWPAIFAALGAAALVGAVNGVLVAQFRLNALIVTLATGSIVTGLTIAWRERHNSESAVPQMLADFSSARLLGIPASVWMAAALLALLSLVLRKSVIGRRFELLGANPEAAHAIGIRVRLYQMMTFTLAGGLYGGMGILLAGFIRNPTLAVGAPYLLAPIAAAVLAGTSLNGGIGSMASIAGAALFMTQLDQSIKMLGLPTAWQMVIQGLAIAFGMSLSNIFSAKVRR